MDISDNELLPDGTSGDLLDEISLTDELNASSGWARSIDLGQYTSVVKAFQYLENVISQVNAKHPGYDEMHVDEANAMLLEKIDEAQNGGLGEVTADNYLEFIPALLNLYPNRFGIDPANVGGRISTDGSQFQGFGSDTALTVDLENEIQEQLNTVAEAVTTKTILSAVKESSGTLTEEMIAEVTARVNIHRQNESLPDLPGNDSLGSEMRVDHHRVDPEVEEGILFELDATLTASFAYQKPDALANTDAPLLQRASTTKLIEDQKPTSAVIDAAIKEPTASIDSLVSGALPEWEKLKEGELESTDVSKLLSDLGLSMAPLLHASQDIMRRAFSADKQLASKTHIASFRSDMKEFIRNKLEENKPLLLFVMAKEMGKEFAQRWQAVKNNEKNEVFTRTLQDDCLEHMGTYLEKAHPIVNRALNGIIKAIS